jgi:4-hydroxy-3-methylbut-2-enyl diphosphate reductase
VHVTEEDEYFPPPRELRELMHVLDSAAPALFGGPISTSAIEGAFTDDRRVDASSVLAGDDG